MFFVGGCFFVGVGVGVGGWVGWVIGWVGGRVGVFRIQAYSDVFPDSTSRYCWEFRKLKGLPCVVYPDIMEPEPQAIGGLMVVGDGGGW